MLTIIQQNVILEKVILMTLEWVIGLPSYKSNYYTGYFKMNTISTSGVAMSTTNATYYPVGGD